MPSSRGHSVQPRLRASARRDDAPRNPHARDLVRHLSTLWACAPCTAMQLVGLASALMSAATAAAADPAPPRLTISKHCNASIQSSNYNYGFQYREDWEFSAWRTFSGFLRPLLPMDPPPSTIVDVGCGFALYDIHVHRHYHHKVKIICASMEHRTRGTRLIGRVRIRSPSLCLCVCFALCQTLTRRGQKLQSPCATRR